jgi:hypothetical protein
MAEFVIVAEALLCPTLRLVAPGFNKIAWLFRSTEEFALTRMSKPPGD